MSEQNASVELTAATPETTQPAMPLAAEMAVTPAGKPRKKTNEVKVSEARFVEVYNDVAITSMKQVAETLRIDTKLVSVKACLARKKGLLTRNLGKGPRNTNKSGAATTNA